MWLLNFYNKYDLCCSERKINYIFCESLYLPFYSKISKTPLPLNCHGGISGLATLSGKRKITIMLFNCMDVITDL